MPVDKQVIRRYRIIDQCLRSTCHRYTKVEILSRVNTRLEEDGFKTISLRTLENDLAEIEAQGGILEENIKNGREKVYRYRNVNCEVKFLKLEDKDREKIKDAIEVLEYFQGIPQYDWVRIALMQVDSEQFMKDNEREYISFQNNEDYKGIEHFTVLLKAIIDKQPLEIRYKPFDKAEFVHKCFPYYLKQYNNRWFIFIREKGRNDITNLALDRIIEIKDWFVDYKETDIDFYDYFYDIVGVTRTEEEPENVVLKINKERFSYIETKPLHGSQKFIAEDDEFVIIQLTVQLNKELDALILSYGNDIEVLEPEDYRGHIKEKIDDLYKKYSNNAENLRT